MSAVVQVDVLRLMRSRPFRVDRVAAEARSEVRLHGEPFSVIMRTPGADHDLSVGFLFTEGVVRGVDDIARVENGDVANVVNVTLTPARGGQPELLGHAGRSP
jgi:FdhD protein